MISPTASRSWSRGGVLYWDEAGSPVGRLAGAVDLAILPFDAATFGSFLAEHHQNLAKDEPVHYVLHGGEGWRHTDDEALMLTFLQLCLPGIPVLNTNNRYGYREHALAYELTDSGRRTDVQRELAHLRATSRALGEGDFRVVHMADDVLVIGRDSAWHRYYGVLNFAPEESQVELGAVGQWIAGTHELHGDGSVHSGGPMRLSPYEARLYELRRRPADVPAV